MNRAPFTAEERASLTDDHWRRVFNRYDVNNDERISLCELKRIINCVGYKTDIPNCAIKKILKEADLNGDGTLEFDEFLQMVKQPENKPYLQHLMSRYVYQLVPRRSYRQLLHAQRHSHDGNNAPKTYEDYYSCSPLPIAMVVISVAEILMYFVNMGTASDDGSRQPVADALIYDPRKKREAWRFVSYMFVHSSTLHITLNVTVQTMLGVPLEMVHKRWRVLLVYVAGVLAGSLVTSVVPPSSKLAGASSGVFAIMTAHISTIIMNWNEMEFALLQLIVFLIFVLADVIMGIYTIFGGPMPDSFIVREMLGPRNPVSYAAHAAGAVAGLLVGINVLRDLKVTRADSIIRSVSLTLYVVLMATVIVMMVVHTAN